MVLHHSRLFFLTALATISIGMTAYTVHPRQAPPPVFSSPIAQVDREPDVHFVPTPQAVVDEMLRVAKVGPRDKLYDLGSGDGRIVITAAKKFGTRGVGIEIDPELIQEAQSNARRAGVADRVEFRQQDLFLTDLRDATVISLYLLPSLNLRLRPKLLSLKPGTRIVSHAFDMGDWQPDKVVQVGGNTIYFWTVPARTAAPKSPT